MTTNDPTSVRGITAEDMTTYCQTRTEGGLGFQLESRVDDPDAFTAEFSQRVFAEGMAAQSRANTDDDRRTSTQLLWTAALMRTLVDEHRALRKSKGVNAADPSRVVVEIHQAPAESRPIVRDVIRNSNDHIVRIVDRPIEDGTPHGLT